MHIHVAAAIASAHSETNEHDDLPKKDRWSISMLERCSPAHPANVRSTLMHRGGRARLPRFELVHVQMAAENDTLVRRDRGEIPAAASA